MAARRQLLGDAQHAVGDAVHIRRERLGDDRYPHGSQGDRRKYPGRALRRNDVANYR
jgi:hypothetical protein